MRGSIGLWQALETARRRNLDAAGDAPPAAGAPGTTRRALLKGMLAASLVPALPRPAHAYRGGRVAIIGGGIAGLSALHRLRAEASTPGSTRPGAGPAGGCSPIARPAARRSRSGGQLVNTDHKDMHDLARQFGIALIDRKADPHRTLDPRRRPRSPGGRSPRRCARLPPDRPRFGTDGRQDPRLFAALDRLSIRAISSGTRP
jgi:monoamine oxidase